jgi:hypothetical protein
VRGITSALEDLAGDYELRSRGPATLDHRALDSITRDKFIICMAVAVSVFWEVGLCNTQMYKFMLVSSNVSHGRAACFFCCSGDAAEVC